MVINSKQFRFPCLHGLDTFLNNFQAFPSLGEGNLIFCCTGPTNSNLANNDNNTDLTYRLFLLRYSKIYKNQKFAAFDIVESQRKEIWWVLCVTCVGIIA